MNKDRKMITVTVKELDIAALLDRVTPDGVIAAMRDIQSLYSGRDIHFVVKRYYDDMIELELMENRLENDKEFKKRMKIEAEENARNKSAREKKEVRERAQYERLKKKFDDGGNKESRK